jgi:hypothetical protein
VFSPEFVTSAALIDGELVVGLRLNWFRPLPLSCVEELVIAVDGDVVESAVFELDGARHDVRTLHEQDAVWWRLASDAAVHVPCEEPAAQVRVTMRTRLPMLVDPAGAPVVVGDTAVVEVPA